MSSCHLVILSLCGGINARRDHVLSDLDAAPAGAAAVVELEDRRQAQSAAARPGRGAGDQPYELDRHPYPGRLAAALAPALVDRQDRDVSQPAGDLVAQADAG